MSDRRRILGPSDAKIPLAGDSSSPLIAQEKTRTEEGVRNFFIKSGSATNANGLAFLEVGNTIVEVSVYGPRPIKGLFIDRASFSVECKFLPFITQPNEILYNGATSHSNGRTGLTHIEQRISTYVETAFLPAVLLEKYPKSTIDVFIKVLAFDSNTTSILNLIAWIVNCTSIAMVDSGIELRDLVTGGHVQALGEKLLLDSQAADDGASRGSECVASFMPMQNNELVGFWVQGADDEEITEESLDGLIKSCQEMSTLVRKNLNGFMLSLAEKQ